MSKAFKITFSDEQWRTITRHSPTRTGSPPTVLRALLGALFAEREVTWPEDPAPPGGDQGGGRPKKHP